MTTTRLSPAAKGAQDAARQDNGRFGEQAKSDPGELNLSTRPADLPGAALADYLPGEVTAVLIDEEDDGAHVAGFVVRGQRFNTDELTLDDDLAFAGDLRSIIHTPLGAPYRMDHNLGAYRLDVRPDPWTMPPDEVERLLQTACANDDANLLVECWDAIESEGEPEDAPSDRAGHDRYDAIRISNFIDEHGGLGVPVTASAKDYESGGGVILTSYLSEHYDYSLAREIEDGDLSDADWSASGRVAAVGYASAMLRAHKQLAKTRQSLGL